MPRSTADARSGSVICDTKWFSEPRAQVARRDAALRPGDVGRGHVDGEAQPGLFAVEQVQGLDAAVAPAPPGDVCRDIIDTESIDVGDVVLPDVVVGENPGVVLFHDASVARALPVPQQIRAILAGR